MMITYATEKDKNGKARYYRVTDGKKKVISRAEYEAHTCETNNEIPDETPAVETASTSEAAEENVQIAFEEISVSEDVSNDSSSNDIVEADEADSESANNDIAFEIVKGIVKAAGNKNSEKLCLQYSKKCDLVCYKNRVVCTFSFGKQGEITAVKFMGTTVETRKIPSIYTLHNCSELYKYREDILKQIEFIDLWYLSRRKAS